MHSKSDNIEIMINNKADEVFNSRRNRYQNNLEKSMKASEFVFDYVHSLYYKCNKIIPNHGGSYVDSPDWIKNKKAAINSINKKENKYFQYTATAALNNEKITKYLQRMTKIKLFKNKYNWEGIDDPSEKVDRKKLRKIM